MTTLRHPINRLALACALGLPQAGGRRPCHYHRGRPARRHDHGLQRQPGLVKETRRGAFDSGLVEARYADVAAQIDPTSVHLRSLTEPPRSASSSRTTSTTCCRARS